MPHSQTCSGECGKKVFQLATYAEVKRETMALLILLQKQDNARVETGSIEHDAFAKESMFRVLRCSRCRLTSRVDCRVRSSVGVRMSTHH
jgi:hypothetical protein